MRKVLFKNFIGSFLRWGIICLALTFILASIIVAKRDDTADFLQDKKLVFLAAADKVEKIEPSERKLKAVDLGKHIREEYLKGKPLDEIIKMVKKAEETIYNHGQSEAVLEQLAKNLKIPEVTKSLLSAAKSEWVNKLDNKEIIALKLVLDGKNAIPKTYDEYEKEPVWLYFMIILTTQFGMFFGHLTKFGLSWYCFPWMHIWPFFAILIMLPGALPLIIIMSITNLIRAGFYAGCAWQDRAARRRDTKSAFEMITRSSRKRLEVLKEQLEKGGA